MTFPLCLNNSVWDGVRPTGPSPRSLIRIPNKAGGCSNPLTVMYYDGSEMMWVQGGEMTITGNSAEITWVGNNDIYETNDATGNVITWTKQGDPTFTDSWNRIDTSSLASESCPTNPECPECETCPDDDDDDSGKKCVML